MEVNVHGTRPETGKAAARKAARDINAVIKSRGEANLVLATGTSQLEMLSTLVEADVPWGKVTVFHLDEYVGLSDSHPASFVRYLRERFEERLPQPPKEFHYIDGTAENPEAECRRLNDIIRHHPLDVGCIGIGENGHLAFNDPPADFQTEEPFIIVELDETCRQQQVGEGWFETMEDVPEKAITMSMRQIMKIDSLIVTCPDRRKAPAVKGAVEGEVTPSCPASLLQRHPDCTLFLDENSAAELSQ